MLRHAGVTPEGRHHPVPAEAPDERTGHRGKRPGVHHPGQLRRTSTRGWWTGQEPAGRTGRARARRCHSDQHGWTEPHSFSPVCRLAHSPGRAGRLPAADQQQPQRGRGPGRRRPGPVAVARDDGAKRPDRVHHRQGRHQDRRDPPDLRRHDPDLELRGAGQRQHRPDHHHHRQSGLGRAGAVSHQHENFDGNRRTANPRLPLHRPEPHRESAHPLNRNNPFGHHNRTTNNNPCGTTPGNLRSHF
uniref:(northern house mosquito) hypothetical protein n=1 Tax=Culex pipiens TaxID=7175 RepID=A0A8D8PCI3_CULPI